MNRRWQIPGIVITMLLVWMLSSQPAVRQYVEQVKHTPGTVDTFGVPETEAVMAFAPAQPAMNEELLNAIRAEAEKRREEPVDAKLDRVWKAIPGYNGIEVDVERTYQLALLHGGGNIPYVYREIPPKVNLEQLGAQPIYKGNPRKPMVALMINVAWGDEFLPSILETLNKENVHATFFFDGTWLKKNKETAAEIGKAGHELSNHAYTHPNMSQLSAARQRDEISRTESLLKELGVTNKLFAPPSGDYNEQTVQIAHEMGLRTVLWTIDTVDWQNPPADGVVRKVASRLEPGAMILMHPTKTTKEALPGMIRAAKQKGYVLGTVSELLATDRVPTIGEAPEGATPKVGD